MDENKAEVTENKDLVKCKHCGHLISKEAKTCPNCGGKNKTSNLPLILIVIVTCILFFGMVIISVNDFYGEDVEVEPTDAEIMSEEEYKAACTEISYDTLAREGENRYGEKVKMTGKIFQVVYDDKDLYSEYLAQTVLKDYYSFQDYTDGMIYIYYERGEKSKVLEDDIVNIYGEIEGDYSYETVNGATMTVPKIRAYYIDINS